MQGQCHVGFSKGRRQPWLDELTREVIHVVAMNSNTDVTRVYVRLPGEGTEVYRPAPAIPVGAGTMLLQAPEGYDAEDEEWEFTPGTVVRVERRTRGDRDVLVAVAAAPGAA